MEARTEEKTSELKLLREIPQNARAWRNDRNIYKWCRQATLIDEKSHERWLQKISEDPTIEMFGIFVSGIAVGVCGLTSINRLNQSAEFSLYIGPEYQGKGFGKEALKQLLNIGFNDLNLNRIWGETFDGNPAIKTFESLGMVKEGTLRKSYFKEGKFIDSHIYAIIRPTSQISELRVP